MSSCCGVRYRCALAAVVCEKEAPKEGVGSGEVSPKRSKEFVLTTHSIFYTQVTLHHDVPTMHLDEAGDVCIRPGCFPPACPASTAQTSHVLSPPLPSIPPPLYYHRETMNSDAGAGTLEQFTILAKSTKGNGCATLIQNVRDQL